jgi:hypothetical protein
MSKLTPRRLVVVLGLLALVVTGVLLTSTSEAAQKTKKLHGHMEGIHNTHTVGIPIPFGPEDPGCLSASGVCSRFTARGDIKGDGLVFIDTFPNNDVPSFSKAHTTITTKKGNLTCTEAALFDLSNLNVPHFPHTFVDECIITGGTGIYGGATGAIQEVGTYDFTDNLGELEYYGTITYADGVKPNDMDGD